jgi:hypothetical protein
MPIREGFDHGQAVARAEIVELGFLGGKTVVGVCLFCCGDSELADRTRHAGEYRGVIWCRSRIFLYWHAEMVQRSPIRGSTSHPIMNVRQMLFGLARNHARNVSNCFQSMKKCEERQPHLV